MEDGLKKDLNIYPLVNNHSWLEYPPFLFRKYIFNPGPFSIATLVYRSVRDSKLEDRRGQPPELIAILRIGRN